MVDFNNISETVKNFVNDVKKSEGNAKQIDTKTEYDKLSSYLAGEKANMNQDEINNIQGLCVEYTIAKPEKNVTPKSNEPTPIAQPDKAPDNETSIPTTNKLWALALGGDKKEQSVISISDYDINDPKYTDAEQYKEYIATIYKDTPTKAEAFQKLVDHYQAQYGDEWHTHYWQELREMAGLGSKLNPDECGMIKYEVKYGDTATGETEAEALLNLEKATERMYENSDEFLNDNEQ